MFIHVLPVNHPSVENIKKEIGLSSASLFIDSRAMLRRCHGLAALEGKCPCILPAKPEAGLTFLLQEEL